MILSKLDFDKALLNLLPSVGDAFRQAHSLLIKAGVPHIVVGGIAVNTYGHEYTTKDVDFLVGDEILDKDASKFVMIFIRGIPVKIGDVEIDYLDPDVAHKHPKMVEILKESLDAARENPDNILIISLPVLIYMKLNANRPKDTAAVIGLLEAGSVDVDEVISILNECAPDLLLRFTKLVERTLK